MASRLPHLALERIFTALHTLPLDGDQASLANCMLVNRHWGAIAAPILWRRPFFHYGCLNLDSLLACLDKTARREIEVAAGGFDDNDEEFVAPAYNYASHVRELDFC